MSGGGAGGSRTTIAPTGTIDAMAMTTGDIVAIERATATMADVMRAVTAGGDAVGIATTIDPEAPKATPQWNERARRFGGLFAGAFSARPRCARRRPGGLPQGFHRRNDRGMVVYFDFFGTRFFCFIPYRPDGSVSSP